MIKKNKNLECFFFYFIFFYKLVWCKLYGKYYSLYIFVEFYFFISKEDGVFKKN